MERHNMCMRLKSGREFRFSCKKYTITRFSTTQELAEVEFENVSGECPKFFEVSNIESISEYTELEGSMMQMAKAIRKQCLKRYPAYRDCHRCECFDKFEGKCKLGDPSTWPINKEEEKE